MAIILKEDPREEILKLTERVIQKTVYFLWPDGYTSFPNVNLFGWEMDLALVSNSNYLTEVEIKLTLSDWKRDCKKEKFMNVQYHPKRFKYIKYFYYAIPEKLLSKMPDHVSPDTGIITFDSHGVVTIHRQAQSRKGCEKLTDRRIVELFSKFYWRYRWWDSRWDPKNGTNFMEPI